MEIESSDGSKTRLKPGQETILGRGHGSSADDRTVSRRHVSFKHQKPDHKDEPMVRFEVIGMNPIWVYSKRSGEVRTFRRSEVVVAESGDMLCFSGKSPVWFTLRKAEADDEDDDRSGAKEESLGIELADCLESDTGSSGVELGVDSVDISDIDPVKEFGFVVMGKEFDCYPKRMIKDIKNWDWFIEEPREESEEDQGSRGKGRKSGWRKRKKGEENEDEEWTGVSEDEKELIEKSRKVQKPKYLTRSKDRGKTNKDTRNHKSSSEKKTACEDEEYVEDEDEDEDDETLGSFIVDDEDLEQEGQIDEEEFEEDEDD